MEHRLGFGLQHAALALLGSVSLAACATKAPPPPPPPTVDVSVPLFRDLRTWDEFTGKIEPIQSVELRARVGGFIDAISFTEGERVHRGQVLYQIDPRPFKAEVDRLRAELVRATAVAEQARLDGERAKREIAQNAISQQEFERLDAQSKAAAAGVGSARAALQAAELNLSYTRVTSPVDGRISKALITRGNLVATSNILTTIVSENPIYASFVIDEPSFLKYASAQRGQGGPAYVGLMSEKGFPHRGTLQFLDNAVDPGSGTITARAILSNPDGQFTPGLFARVRLASKASSHVALLPDDAIGTDLGKRFVLVLDLKKHVEYRLVEPGPAIGGLRIVKTGLKPGDIVVVSGLQRVKPGDLVTPKKVPTTPAPPELNEVAADS